MRVGFISEALCQKRVERGGRALSLGIFSFLHHYKIFRLHVQLEKFTAGIQS